MLYMYAGPFVFHVLLYVLTLWQFWLLGYEFPATLFLFTMEALYVVTTAKKGESIGTPDLQESDW